METCHNPRYWVLARWWVAPDISLVDVMLVETLGYNLLLVCALGKMGFAVFIDNEIVVLLWSKSLKVAFVGHVENNLYVVDFSGKTTTNAMCLFGKANEGWLWHLKGSFRHLEGG